MKKNLRLLCLGLVAAAFTSGFAQEPQDMTSLLKNTDMEQGLKGWVFDGTKVMSKNTKNLFTRPGFYGMSNAVLEAWNGDANTGISDGYIMQRLGGGQLPNGTYVFGAYAAASKQNHRKPIKVMEDGKEVVKSYEFWSNRDSIQGVYLFANDSEVSVATNNPDWNDSFSESHAAKFNVAVNLTEDYARPGYLTVGLRYEETNANYIVWDNPTLYYFGDMSEEDALDAMAKIDMQNIIEVADTFVTKDIVMQNDTLADLKAAIKAARAKNTTAATLWEDSEVLFYQLGFARKSQNDYANLKNNIKSATKVLENPVWDMTAEFLPMLEEQLNAANEAYENRTSDRGELTELRKKLNYFVGAVKLDSFWIAEVYLNDFIDEIRGNASYSAAQKEFLTALSEEISEEALPIIDELWPEDGFDYDNCVNNPNDLWPYVARIYEAVEQVKNNPVSTDYYTFPIEIKTGAGGWVEGAVDEGGFKVFASPTYKFERKIQEVIITIPTAQSGERNFALSALEFYDGEGELIELTEDNVKTDFCHNTINPTGKDGDGIPALFDGVPETYFHSAWWNTPAGDPNLKVTLPEGYDMFSFKMYNRKGNTRTFPAKIILTTPLPNRDALKTTLASAKELNPYSGNEVGFYEEDYSYLLDAIVEVEEALKGNPSEAQCETLDIKLKNEIAKFNATMLYDPILPDPEKTYHIVSAFAGFYEKQNVEKAITIHTDTIQSLWWETANAGSALQKFVFKPIMVDGEHYYKNVKGTDYYAYTLKNVGTGLYVDSAFVDNKLQVVEVATDTVYFGCLGRGQWQIEVRGNVLHVGDHNGGAASDAAGVYGGTKGVESAIVAYNSENGLDGKSAWFIREMPELPLEGIEVVGSKFKSPCYHFNSANTIILTADKDCKFADLTLYDFYGSVIEVEDINVVGNKAVISVGKDIVGCAFAFTNNEDVKTVSFNALITSIDVLQRAYDAAVAIERVEGNAIMEYADLSKYNAALAKAEALLAVGAATEDEVKAVVEELEAAVAALKPNMPEDGKYYFIFCGDDSYEKNNGYRMGLRVVDSMVSWAAENALEWNRYWQLESVTVDGKQAYYIKSTSDRKYMPLSSSQSTQLGLVSKSEAAPYAIDSWGESNKVTIQQLGGNNGFFHAQANGQHLVFWWDKTGVRSSWTIVEAQYDVTDIDFAEVETEKAVVKGTYDLFGRRVVAPTAPGLYIIDGKKKYIKK